MHKKLKENIGSNGLKTSPRLRKGLRNFIIDIDGVISEDIPNEEPERMVSAKVVPGSKEQINSWYDDGHIITLFTARTQKEAEVTKAWLKKNGYKYHNIIFGKPRGGSYHYIDDKHVRASTFKKGWTRLVRKKMEIEVFE